MSETLYERIGGKDAVDAAVELFYKKVLADERINSWFKDTDMVKQVIHQTAFVTMALGGPSIYSGKDMRAAHAPLVKKGLNDADFDAVVEDFGITLKEMNVPEDLITEVAATIETTRADVLCR